MNTRSSIRTCLPGLLALTACEGNSWPANPPAMGLDASAAHAAMERAFAVDAPASMGTSHPSAGAAPPPLVARPAVTLAGASLDATARFDGALAPRGDIATGGPSAIANAPATVYVPVYLPIYVPTGAGASEPLPALPVAAPRAPTVAAPASAATLGTGGTLGQYGTPGAFSTTGVTAGDPGTLRGTFP